MTTREAFEAMISTKGIHKKLGIEAKQKAVLKNRFNTDQMTLDKMEELLLIAGWSKVPEYWHRPK